MSAPRSTSGSLRWWVLGVLGVAFMTAVVVWWGLRTSVGAVRPEVVAYAVESDQQMRLDYRMVRPEATPVLCTLTALDDRKGAVGTVTDLVPAGDRQVTRSVTIRTTHRAVTGVVTSCVRQDG